MRAPRIFLTISFALALASVSAVVAQEHKPAPQPPTTQDSAAPKGAQPVADHPQEADHPPAEHVVRDMIARLVNFGILVGVLVYFMKSPIAAYLATRSTHIRQDLVTAAEMRSSASAQLSEIQARMAALPAELDALRRQGAEDVRAEKGRIAEAAAHERSRLLDQTRREIDTRLRVAKRELTEHAATLAVQVAEQRIKRSITPDDQIRLVDRYAAQLREAR